MQTRLELGATIDTLTRTEVSGALAEHAQEIYRQQARGCKYMRMPPAQAQISNSTFSLDGSRYGLGPREGFVWSLRRLAVSGLTAGTTPDVVNLYRNGTSGLPIWQLNGNNWGATFGKCEFLLLGGETLSIASLGTVTATGQVTLTGDLLEVPAEEIYKLF
jgi:hypothetical protein